MKVGTVDFKASYPSLALYCDTNSLPYPEVVYGQPLTKGAVASCDPYSWRVIVNAKFGDVSEKTMGHELAHLIVRIDAKGDSITHGPKFVNKELEIERFCTYERRKRLRAKKSNAVL